MKEKKKDSYFGWLSEGIHCVYMLLCLKTFFFLFFFILIFVILCRKTCLIGQINVDRA